IPTKVSQDAIPPISPMNKRTFPACILKFEPITNRRYDWEERITFQYILSGCGSFFEHRIDIIEKGITSIIDIIERNIPGSLEPFFLFNKLYRNVHSMVRLCSEVIFFTRFSCSSTVEVSHSGMWKVIHTSCRCVEDRIIGCNR